MDNVASNFNEDATDEDGSCIYSYNLNYQSGPNLVSFYVLPEDELTYSTEILINDNFNIDNIIALLGQNEAVVFTENGMFGSLTDISRLDGYWLKINNDSLKNKNNYYCNIGILYKCLSIQIILNSCELHNDNSLI